MSDLISRQAAIDALHMHLMYRMGTDSNKKRLDDWINSLPSAQPEKRTEERAETHACDLIDREAAVDAIYHHLPSVSRTRARTMLHEVPSAQPEQKWIPCSERLPVEGESVFLCDRNKDMTLGRLVRTNEGCYWDIYGWWNDTNDWNAWMPLPEPYQEEKK